MIIKKKATCRMITGITTCVPKLVVNLSNNLAMVISMSWLSNIKPIEKISFFVVLPASIAKLYG